MGCMEIAWHLMLVDETTSIILSIHDLSFDFCFSILPYIVTAAQYSTVYSELIKTRTSVCLSV